MTTRLTTDPNDPRLGHGVGGDGMNEAYTEPRPCSKRRCKREATVAYDVRPSFMRIASAEYGLDQAKVPIRHYEVCEKHDAEFFGVGGWLTDTQAERIRKELVERG